MRPCAIRYQVATKGCNRQPITKSSDSLFRLMLWKYMHCRGQPRSTLSTAKIPGAAVTALCRRALAHRSVSLHVTVRSMRSPQESRFAALVFRFSNVPAAARADQCDGIRMSPRRALGSQCRYQPATTPAEFFPNGRTYPDRLNSVLPDIHKSALMFESAISEQLR